jgi:hypothetical protein
VWALVIARARPVFSVLFGALYALMAVAFWSAALARPYGLFVDPAITQRVAECAVATSSGPGWEGVLSGEPAASAGSWLAHLGIPPRALLFAPTLAAPLLIPLAGILLHQLWTRRDRAWTGALLWLAFPTGDLDGLSAAGLLPGTWAHPLGAAGVLASLLAVLVAARNRYTRRWVVVGSVLAALWVAAGVQWARLGEGTTPLGIVDRLLLVSVRQGLWLPVGWYGLLRRGEPAARALVLAGLVAFVLPPTAVLRIEPWGPLALYRLGLMMGAAAPAAEAAAYIGAALKRRVASLGGVSDIRVGAAAALLALAPGSFPVWWQPVQLDPVFAESLDAVPAIVVEAAAAVRAQTPPQAVVVAGPEYAPAVGALAGRRLLRLPFRRAHDEDNRWRAEDRVLAGRPEAPAARPYGVTHVLIGVGDFADHGITAPEELAGRGFRLLWQHPEGVRLYAVPPAR